MMSFEEFKIAFDQYVNDNIDQIINDFELAGAVFDDINEDTYFEILPSINDNADSYKDNNSLALAA